MTDPKNDEEPIDNEQAPKYRRARNYGRRRTVSLRISIDMHEHMMDLCDSLQTPANVYISKLIENDLKKRKK